MSVYNVFSFNINGVTTTLTVPPVNDTIVGKVTTDTLQNKTLQGGASGNVVTANQFATSGSPVVISGAAATNQTIQTTSTTTAVWGNLFDARDFGTGVDADPNIGSGATVTLARDMYYANLTIANTGTLRTNGFRVYVKGTTTLNGTASINNNGAAGSSFTAGAATNAGTIGIGAAGGAGGVISAAGSAGGGVTAATRLGGTGGAGGAGNGGAGGAGGTATVPATNNGGQEIFNDPVAATRGQTIAGVRVNGGCGGGGGGGGGVGTGRGGGGGGGGGVLIFASNIITGTGTISANGGAGAAGAVFGANAPGGGGGGGGGVVVVMYNSSSIPGGNITATAGAAGAAGGPGGSAGVAGTAGAVYTITR